MYDKVMKDGKTTMQLKKEFGGAMEMSHAKMKSPMDADKPDFPDIDGDGNTSESMKQAAADKKSGSPKTMKSAMDMSHAKMKSAMDMSHAKMKSPMDDAHAAMELETAMKLKSAMDLAKDGPMNLMEESPKKLTQDAAMKMAAAMKKFYNS